MATYISLRFHLLLSTAANPVQGNVNLVRHLAICVTQLKQGSSDLILYTKSCPVNFRNLNVLT